jgi:hypothetical protein
MVGEEPKLPDVRSIAWLDLLRSMQPTLPCGGLSVSHYADRCDHSADEREKNRRHDDVAAGMLPVMSDLNTVIVDSDPKTKGNKQYCERRYRAAENPKGSHQFCWDHRSNEK